MCQVRSSSPGVPRLRDLKKRFTDQQGRAGTVALRYISKNPQLSQSPAFPFFVSHLLCQIQHLLPRLSGCPQITLMSNLAFEGQGPNLQLSIRLEIGVREGTIDLIE